MFKLKKRSLAVILLILLFSVPSFSQENTEEAPASAETDAPIVTEVPTEAPTEAPTEEAIVTEAPTEEAVVTEAPTEEAVVTEAPTEEVAVTEAPTEEAAVTEVPVEPTEEAVTPTEAPVSAIPTRPQGEAVEMLLQYDPNASAESIAAMLQSLGATELERLPQIGVMRVLIPSSVSNVSSAQSVLQSNTLASTVGLMSMEAEEMWQVTAFPNDTFFPIQSNLVDDGPPYDDSFSIFMQSAWGVSPKDGLGVTVAVLDTGLDINHPEFVGKYVAGWNFYDDWSNFDDFHGHGTHVAGVIAAKTNNAVGVAGMAFNSMILPVKVCGDYGCPTYEIAAGIIFAVDRGAKVINMSLGGYAPSTTVLGAINYALSRNVVVVASAGNYDALNPPPLPYNQNSYVYPASYDGVISVAAMGPDGQTIASFSQVNDRVTIAAPGVSILSTWPLDVPEAEPFFDRPAVGYDYLAGTSMAAPHVAALAAMMIADGVATTPAQVLQNLMCTSRDITGYGVGKDNNSGYGLINAYRALTWDSNSVNCQISLPNDFITSPMTITSPTFSIVQPVNDRSVTESTDDPEIDTVQPNQSLWYKFTPTLSGQYMFSSFGSGHNTLLAVYQGQPGALTELEANNDVVINGAYQRRVTLVRGIPYYVQLGTNGADVLNSYVQLNVNPALTLTTLQQENATFIRYTGSWNRVAQTGSNGGFVNVTTDNNATMSFLMRGRDLNLTRLVGPTQGNMEIIVDGLSQGETSNYAPITRSSMITIQLGANTGEWHLVTIRIGSGNAPLSIDALQAVDSMLPTALVGAVRASETTAAFSYFNGTWTPTGKTGALNNNVRESADVGAEIQFRASGSAITIFRSTGTGTGTMDIYIDGVFVTSVDNEDFPTHPSLPFSIANYAARERVVRIVVTGGTVQFDGAQSINQAVLVSNRITDERFSSIIYSGLWTKTANPTTVANAGTLSTAATITDEASAFFMFNGNHLCVGYQRFNGGGDIQLYLDGDYLTTISTNGADGNKIEWCTYDNGFNTLTDGLHSVTLVVQAGQEVRLDFVRPVRRTVFTNTMNYIMETNAGFVYSGIWTTSTQVSYGGAKFQGGSARMADIDDGSLETVSFTINGTGFILYTSLPELDRSAGWFVYVDGVLNTDNVYQGTGINFIPTWGGWDWFRPIAVGVVELDRGIHHIELRGVELEIILGYDVNDDPIYYYPNHPFLHFDGIRVLP